MNDNRQQVFNWQGQGHIKNQDIEMALRLSNTHHTANQWKEFIAKLMLWLGMLSIAIGCIFFFAYNWADLSTFQKFALVQGLMAISTFLYTQSKTPSNSTVILFFLALLIGALFALFGQTYQSGKDPWQLILIWSVFIVPLAFTSRSSSLWLLWLALANGTLFLYLQTTHGLLGILFQNERNVLAYALLNLLAAAGFEALNIKQLIKNRVAAQVALVLAMAAFTWVAIYSVFEFLNTNNKALDLVIYILWMGAVYFYYRIKSLDVLVLSSWIFSGIIFILSVVARMIGKSFDEATLLLYGLLIIGLSTMGVKWLMKLIKPNASGDKA